MITAVKNDLKARQNGFNRRSHDRSNRMRGLVDLFQRGEIDVKKFRHLTALLKAEHRDDCKQTGLQFKDPSLV